jgi:hypothetical protein
MDILDMIFWSIVYVMFSYLAYRVAMNISKGFQNSTLRFLFVLICTLLSVPFLAIVFVIVTNKVDKHEKR